MKYHFIFPLVAVVFFIGSLTAAQAGEYNKKHNKMGKGHTGSGMMMDMHFNDLDSDGNSVLSFEEFKQRFPTSTEKSFNTLDTDRNGTLSHDEWHRFKEMHRDMEPYHKKEKFHGTDLPDPSGFNAAFSDMDKNGDDKVNIPEFRSRFPNGTEHEKVFNAVDLDRNGYLTEKEWHKFRMAHGMYTAD